MRNRCRILGALCHRQRGDAPGAGQGADQRNALGIGVAPLARFARMTDGAGAALRRIDSPMIEGELRRVVPRRLRKPRNPLG